MRQTVKVLMYGDEAECCATSELLATVEHLGNHAIECRKLDDDEEFIAQLVRWEPSLIIVLADGAAGMECVTQAKMRRPEIPMFWFSDDRNFGMYAYRMNCAYFSLKPVDTEKLNNAFRRCEHVGIPYLTI